MTNPCAHCGGCGEDIFSHRPFAHTKEVRHYCAGCGQRIHDYKPGPRGLGKVVMTREPPKPPVNATHPVRFYPKPKRAQRLRINGREPQREERGAEYAVGFQVVPRSSQ